MPDRRVVEAYLASDRAMAVSARVVDHRNVASTFTALLRAFWSNRLTNLQRPMTSLRDVDAAGKIRAGRRTIGATARS